MPYKIQYSIEVNGDTITEVTLLCDAKYMNPAHECSFWYLDPEFGSIYTKVSLKIILLPKLNVEVIIDNQKLHRDVSTLTQSE